MKTIGRSLPHQVAATIAQDGGIPKFLSRSDGDDETPRALLTGGLLVRVQPEEPISLRKSASLEGKSTDSRGTVRVLSVFSSRCCRSTLQLNHLAVLLLGRLRCKVFSGLS